MSDRRPTHVPRRAALTGLAAAAGAWLLPRAGMARPVALDLRGSVNAADRGLVASGGGDQTRRLQRLLDETAGKAELLFLPAGDYAVDALDLPAGTRLVGVPGATRLFGPRLSLRAAGARSIALSGLTFDGLAQTGEDGGPDLAALADCADLVVSDCRLENARGYALLLQTCAGRVEGSTFSGAALAAILTRDATGLRIAGNWISDCGNGGILVHRKTPSEDGSLVSGNRVSRIRADAGGTGQNGNGINLFRAHGVTVTDNRLEDCAFSALRANGGSNAILSGNQCHRSGETAIYSEFVFEGAVIEGNIVDGAAIGISIANFNEGGRLAVCTGNLVRNLRTLGPYPADAPGFGMGISVEADTVVSNNVVEGAPLFGIKLGWGPYLRDVAATGNVLRGCRVGIAVSAAEGAGATLIASNVVSGSTAGAIVGYRWTEALTDDLIRDPGSAPSHVTLAANIAR